MKLLLPYIRRNARTAVAALMFAAVNQILILLDPVILRRIVDNYALSQAPKDQAFYTQVGLLLAAGVAVSFFAWVAKNYQIDFTHRATRRISLQLYSDGVRNCLSLPYESMTQQQSGEIAGKLQTARHDADRYLVAFVNHAYTPLIGISFLIVYAAQIHWSLVAVYIVAVPGLIAASYLLGRRVRDIQNAILAETGRLSGAAVEVLRNMELVRSMGLVTHQSERVQAASARILELETQKNWAVRRLSFFHGAGVNSLRLGIVVLMLFLVSHQTITIGEFFSLFLYLYLLLNPIQELGTVLFLHRETEASLLAVAPLLEHTAAPAPKPETHRPPPLHHIGFRNVSFAYSEAARPAISDLSFDVQRGEFIAFVGPSGAGKSTLLKVLLGLYRPASGTILLNAAEPAPSEFDSLRERAGLVTQDVQLFSGTIRDNLLFVRPDATDAECWEALRQAAATPLLARAARGMDTPIGEGGIQLSGGEKQRLAIARALLRNPSLLIFDEATSALDSLTEREVTESLRLLREARNTIMIAIAHRISTIADADRIYVLNRGGIVDAGTHDELLAREGLYRDLWQQQTGAGRNRIHIA